jgi:tellurite resistance protein
MANREDLAPLFTDVPMTSDDANAIVAALRDIAESDGVHDEELQLIAGFVEMLNADLGDAPGQQGKMTPEKLALTLVDPTLRTVAVQCAVLLGMADGKLTPKERARIVEYATALGVTGKDYDKVESTIVGWVKSGDAAAMM